MNQLFVEFHGICVFLSQAQNPSLGLPAPYRVVLPFVNAPVVWHGKTVHVHAPYVSIESAPLKTFLPSQVTLSVDPLPGPLGVSGSLPCLVPLKSIFPLMVLDTEVVTKYKAPAAAYFDIYQGTLSTIAVGNAAGTRLTIETTATEALLKKTMWDETVETVTIPLQEGAPAVIVMSDIAKKKDDRLDDFILNFAVGTVFPPPQHIEERMIEKLLGVGKCLGHRSPTRDLGPGCSNSTFP